MSEFDNTVILYDENGNEIEFEIVHFCGYKGQTYYVLWGGKMKMMRTSFS